uniref:RNA helicase n=1 Tax=Apteryx owenii TaxID=8824 RepID=A0A8B9P8X7_APTOW
MSASINCKEFADYFAIPVHNKLNPAYIFEVEGKPYAIEEYYLDDLKHTVLFKLPPQIIEEPAIVKEMYDVAVSLIQSFDELEMTSNRENKTLGLMSERGSVLVFLPGEYRYLSEMCNSLIELPSGKVILSDPCVGKQKDNVFTGPACCKKQIILLSLLVGGYFVNSRAGRVSKGYCYRLVRKDFWTNCIPEKPVPEILRCPLGTTILRIKMLDMGEPKALLATALSPPSVGDIERTILQLKELGALATCVQTEENPHDGELTFLGRVLAHLPVDQHLGKLIVLGHVFGCLEECLIIAAALSLRTFFAVPFRQHIDGYRNKLFFSGNSKSDCIAIVNAFKVAELFEELKERVRAFNMHINTQPSAMDQEYVYKQRFILQVVIAGAFYPNYFTFGKCDQEIAVRELAGKDPKTTILLRNIPPYGFLYHKQMQSLFRQCGQVKSIAYDGPKAFVEFSRNPMEGFKTLPAVYMSLKMSQLKIPLDLNVHDPDEITRRLAASLFRKFFRVNVDYQKQTVEPAEISFGVSELSKMIPNRLLSVNVTEIVEVGHFWGYRIDEKNMTILQTLTTEINHQNLMDLPVSPHPELVCLAPFPCLENKGYYRARILYVSGDFAEVFFVDYGNRSRVPLKKLKDIPSYLRELPFQALEFKMCKMRPSAKSLVCGEQWSYSASQKFASLVNGYTLLVKVYSLVHSVLHVDVFRYLGSKELVNIRDVLIEECYAEQAEESYESQRSHDLLKALLSDQIRKEEKKPASSREEEKHPIETLLNKFSTSKFGTPAHKVA